MSRPDALRWWRRACVLLVGLLGLNCRDSNAPRFLAGRVAFAPTFQSSTARIVDVNRVRITLVGPLPSSTQALDTVVAIPPNSDSVDLSLTISLTSSREDFDLYLRLLNTAGDTVFRNSPYPQIVTVTSGGTPSLVPAPLEYRGVGYDAVAVVIGTPDTSVLFGDTLRLSATALGATQNPIAGTPIAWRSLDTARVIVPDARVGKVMGGHQRGIARIVAQLLTGPADTVLVTAQPLPATLTLVSGNGQIAVPKVALPLPLRVRVLAGDGLGVRVPVFFRPLATGASLTADTVLSDSLGYAQVTATLGPAVGPQSFDAHVNGIANPVVFNESAVAGAVASVTVTPKLDTIARGTTVQYTAVARDSLGNPVNVTIGWTSTVPSVATVDTTGLALALAADSARIIAGAAGHADTAHLFVRGLQRVVVSPADTVITAIADSFDVHATSYDNFGGLVTTGFVQRFISATPTVVTVNAAGRTHSVGAGNGVVVVRDSVDAALQVQSTATVRVNQIVTRVSNALPVIQIGVGGRGQVSPRAFDRNGYPVGGRTFGYVSRNPRFLSVDAGGAVTGVALDTTTYVVDSLLEGATVYKDSTLVKVVQAPPALLRWGVANDSLSVGTGGSVSVPLTMSRTDSAVRTIFLTSSDSSIARPALACGGSVLSRVVISALTPGTSVLVCGLKAGRVFIKAQDSLNVFAPDSMVVTVVSIVGTPKLFVSLSPTGSAGQRAGFTIYAEDSLGTSRVVTAPVSVALSSNLPTHTAFDSLVVTIPVGSSLVSTGVTFDTAATYLITASATGYASGTGTTIITGALVTMVNTAFSPSTVTIRAGQYVTWRNNDSFNHTTTENSANPVWNQPVAPGTSVQQYFATPGTYNYHCMIHANMTGTVIVNP